MKKALLLLTIIVFCGIFLKGQQPTATISLPDFGGGIPAGEVFTYIRVDDIQGGYDFGTFQFRITYDPEVLNFAAKAQRRRE